MALAAADPSAFVVGIDANAASMAEVSRRAQRAGAPNVLFAVAAAESPPPELRGRVDLVTITFPWGSLLRGVLGSDEAVVAGVASLLRAGGEVRSLVSTEPRDGVGPLDVGRIEAAWRRQDVTLVDARPATRSEVEATRSTWGRRLLADPDRSVTRLQFRAH